jgi:hypothetical protein
MGTVRGSRSPGAWWGGLIVVILLCDLWILRSEPTLPPLVMTKWNSVRATSFMTRDQWMASALFFVTGPSLFVAFVMYWSPRRWPQLIGASFAELTAEDRAAILPIVDRTAFMLAVAVALWFTWFHFIIVNANRSSPPSLAMAPITVWVLAFLGFVAVCAVTTRVQLARATRGRA